MTDREALAALLPCENPEEACDADGASHPFWCDNCIARGVIRNAGLTLIAAGVRLDRTPAVGDEGLRAAVQEISEGEERPVHLEGDSR